MNGYGDEFLMTVKDRYNAFGKIKPATQDFDADNAVELNEFVYQRPWDDHEIHFSLGRFSLPDADIHRHDGVEIGYRWNRSHRWSVFGGAAPRNSLRVSTQRTFESNGPGEQFGVLWTYDDPDADDVSMSHALVRSPADAFNPQTHTYIHHQSSYQPGPAHQFYNQVNWDLAPVSLIRRAYLSYQFQNTDYHLTSSYQRLAADDYEPLRDISYAWRPGKRDTLTLNLSHPLQKELFLEYQVQVSRLSREQRDQGMAGIGSRYQGLAQGQVSLGGWLARRDDEVSKEQLLRLYLDQFQTQYNIHLEHEYSRRRYFDTEETITQNRSSLELGFSFSELLRGSMAYSMTASSRVNIATFYLMLGYSFGSTFPAPMPVRAQGAQGG
jgi:hypothetical protein